MTNYEKIKSMSIDEMANFIGMSCSCSACVYDEPAKNGDACSAVADFEYDVWCKRGVRKWLESKETEIPEAKITRFDRLINIMTPLRLAYLMSKTTSCGDCPAKDKCEGKYDEYKCLEAMRDYLESEVEDETILTK